MFIFIIFSKKNINFIPKTIYFSKKKGHIPPPSLTNLFISDIPYGFPERKISFRALFAELGELSGFNEKIN